MALGFLGTCIFAQDKQYPFFDGTDAKTETLMREAERRIEEVRKGDLSVRLVDPDGEPVNGPVSIDLKSHDFDFGANLFGLYRIEEGNKAKQVAIKAIKELFNTVIVCDYWSQNQSKFNGEQVWESPDYGYRLAQILEMNTRYHALIFGFPHWLHNCKTEEGMWQAIEDRISSVAGRYGDKIREVDVINEFINYQYWDSNPHAQYLKKIGFPDFAKPENGSRVLSIARKHLPEAKLVVLEANLWNTPNPIFQEILDYHRKLIELGADYDYIGYQAHYYAKRGVAFQEGTKEYGPRTFMMDEINRGIEAAAQLGKPIVITEFNAPSRSNAIKNPQQPRISDAEVAAWETNFYTLMFSKPYIKGISRWFTIDNTGGRGMDAGVVTEEGELKPNYFALKKLIKEKWHTRWEGKSKKGKVDFNGFYGTYVLKAEGFADTEVKSTAENPEMQFVLISSSQKR